MITHCYQLYTTNLIPRITKHWSSHSTHLLANITWTVLSKIKPPTPHGKRSTTAQQTCWYSNDDWNPNQKRTKRDAKWLLFHLFHIPSATSTVGTTTKCLAVAEKNTNSTKYRTKAHQYSCTIRHPIIPFPIQETNRPTDPCRLNLRRPSSASLFLWTRPCSIALLRWWWIRRHNYKYTNFIPYLYRSLAPPSSFTRLAPKWKISVCPLPPLYTSLPRRVIAEQIVESMSSPLYYQIQHHRDIILCVRTRARSSSSAHMSLQASALLMIHLVQLDTYTEREGVE